MDSKQTTVFKIGGNVIDDSTALLQFLRNFSVYPGRKILVHGGGRKLSELSQKTGNEVKMIDGRRITDEASLELALMVFSGLINTKIVAALQSEGCNAIGLSGSDGNIIKATRRPSKPIDFGFVGDVDAVNSKTLNMLLNQGLVPVICALTHDGAGQMLNTNADTIASQVASALASTYQVSLVYLLEHPGLMRDVSDENSLIENIDEAGYEKAKQEGIIAAGMIPKMDNAFDALSHGVSEVKIGSTSNFKESLKTCTRVKN
jgi:acetylglutamate kinase